MKTQKELKQEYKERKILAGIFAVRNLANGKVLLGSSKNLDGPLNRHRFMLSIGGHPVTALQEDWKTFGSESFAFEILEEVDIRDGAVGDLDDELTLLEEIWIEKLEPFGEKGYNTDRKIRQA